MENSDYGIIRDTMSSEALNKAINDIEQPFFANKSFNKRFFLSMIKMTPRFYRAYDFPKPNERGEFMRLFYLYMRKIDDVVDGDYANSLESQLYGGEDKANAIEFLGRQRQNIFGGGAVQLFGARLD